jgi:hypothetical protein
LRHRVHVSQNNEVCMSSTSCTSRNSKFLISSSIRATCLTISAEMLVLIKRGA